jgi:hypothetical protein
VVTKRFKLAADEMRPIATGHGACIATDRITVDGEKVGYMVREAPDDDVDSGWRFMAGDESQTYMDDATNLSFYDVNTVANYDPEIVPMLRAPVGSAFERNASGMFVRVEGPDDDDDAALNPKFPIVVGDYALTDNWAITLARKHNRRIEDGSLVLWRPGFTMWLRAYGASLGESAAARMAWLRTEPSPGAFDVIEERDGGVLRFSYRLGESSTDGRVAAFYAFVVNENGHLHMSIYLDEEAQSADARAAWRSVRSRSNASRVVH